MQVVRTGLEVLVRPEAIDELLAVEDPPRRERERGQDFDRTPLAPGGRRDGLTVDFHAEPAEEVDARAGLRLPHSCAIVVETRRPSSNR